MSKTSKFIIPGLVLGASSLLADNGCPPPKPKPECPSKCAQMSHERGPHREITPNAGPCVADGADMFVTVDFIYWTAHEDGLRFAYTDGVNNTLSASPTSTTGKSAFPDFKFRPGFKVGLGVDFEHDGWDLFLEYTWFRSNTNKRSITAASGTTLGSEQVFLASTAVVPATFTSASGKWQLEHFNVVDLELGRNFYISRYLMLRPFAGMKATWQKQKFDNSYSGTTTAGALSATIADNQEQKPWGIGMRIGMDNSWHFTKSFSMLSNIAFSGMWEQFKNTRYATESLSNGTSAILHNLKSNFHAIRSVIEWSLGLRWETWFCDDSYHFSIEGAWEMQWWENQNAFDASAVNFIKSGDLGLQGFTLHLRFDF